VKRYRPVKKEILVKKILKFLKNGLTGNGVLDVGLLEGFDVDVALDMLGNDD